MTEPTLRTRREFLRAGVVGGALGWTIPGFLNATMQSLARAADGALVQTASGQDGPILVVLQLAGGNDGLNTVVPLENGAYHRARPALGLDEKDCLQLDDRTGLHPALGGFKALYDDGLLAVVQGVGYPNPNRSHFRSTEIWQTATDADRTASTGWIGRYFDCCCQGADASVGVSLGKQAPQAFAARQPKGVTFQNANQYRFAGDDEALRMMSGDEAADAGQSIDMLGGDPRYLYDSEPLDFLERTSLDAQVTSDRIQKLASARRAARYPSTALGRDLATVSKLICGGMPTRIYYVSQGGYDTHTSQEGAHRRLLTEFNDAVTAFAKDMTHEGLLNRVVLMTFSEFGRRVKENASGGTDHGTASPMFMLGGKVSGGLHGAMPSLDPQDLDKGDLRFTTDFRSAYATVLEQHLGVDARKILGRSYPLLPTIS